MEPSQGSKPDSFDAVKALRIMEEYGVPYRNHRHLIVSRAAQDRRLARTLVFRLQNHIQREKSLLNEVKQTWGVASGIAMNIQRTIRMLDKLLADINKAVETPRRQAA